MGDLITTVFNPATRDMYTVNIRDYGEYADAYCTRGGGSTKDESVAPIRFDISTVEEGSVVTFEFAVYLTSGDILYVPSVNVKQFAKPLLGAWSTPQKVHQSRIDEVSRHLHPARAWDWYQEQMEINQQLPSHPIYFPLDEVPKHLSNGCALEVQCWILDGKPVLN